MREISFFVVGAQKSGTTALHHQLSKHPSIYLPSTKETHFFDDGHGEYHNGLDYYFEKYFADKQDSQIAGEIDPEYLFFPEVAARLAEPFPSVKLIFILREPISRAFSHYQMSFSRGLDRLPFEQAVARESIRMTMGPNDLNPALERAQYELMERSPEDRSRLINHIVQSDFSYISRGQYADQIERYLTYFPREQMLFLLSEDLRDDIGSAMGKVYDFLGIEYLEPTSLTSTEQNQGAAISNMALHNALLDDSFAKKLVKTLFPASLRAQVKTWLLQRNRKQGSGFKLDSKLARRLRDEYRPHNERLSTLIGRDLSAWLPRET